MGGVEERMESNEVSENATLRSEVTRLQAENAASQAQVEQLEAELAAAQERLAEQERQGQGPPGTRKANRSRREGEGQPRKKRGRT